MAIATMERPAPVLVATRESLVPNFRMAKGVKNIYRSSAPDNLVQILDSRKLLESERFILYDVTLMIDLRSPTEIDEGKSRALIERAPGGQFEEVTELEGLMKSNAMRQVLRLTDCALTRTGFFKYVIQNWISPSEMETADEQGKRELIYGVVNSRGLMGLVEVILETKLFICTVLKAITVHLERRPDGKVIFHCNVGKDRAGVLAMLCESIIGVADEDIIDDFAKSCCIQRLAEQRYTEIFEGKIDSVSFASAKPQTMALTLKYLRTKYGSISSYLDSIGFDEPWRMRFVVVASH